MDSNPLAKKERGLLRTLKLLSLYFGFYIAGIATFLVIIAEPFTLKTYFSDNSLLPGLVNREFSLGTEAEYYYKDLLKLSYHQTTSSLAISPAVVDFLKQEVDNFGLEFYEQNFSYNDDHRRLNGTNIYSIIKGERSANAESIVLCAPYRKDSRSESLSSVSLGLALAKYFSTKSYWAKDVIILFVDHDEYGVSAWLDSYYDVNFRNEMKPHDKNKIYYESLPERSGPIQAAIVLDLHGSQFSRIDVKIQGNYGQLPNLDLFNLVIELAAREIVTPYFLNKSLPFDLTSEELYRHHFETAVEFMKSQATMKADGLHGKFLSYAIQALTLEGPEYKPKDNRSKTIAANLLNVGRMVEGVFRSLNNLTERFNRSYYFYIILSLRRFTSIGYYMVAFGLTLAPVLLKVYNMRQESSGLLAGMRTFVMLTSALLVSLLSTFNISLAIICSVVAVPVLLLI